MEGEGTGYGLTVKREGEGKWLVEPSLRNPAYASKPRTDSISAEEYRGFMYSKTIFNYITLKQQ